MWEKTLYNQWHIRMADSVLARDTQRHAKWEYDDGVVMQGMAELYELTGNEAYLTYVRDLIDSFLEDEGRRIRSYAPTEYNIDHLNNGKMVLYLYERMGDVSYRRAADLLMSQLAAHPRTSEGGFWHKRIYPNQMWLDGIYMGTPFYARYARDFALENAWDDIALQILLCYDHTLDPKTGLLYHGWDEAHAQFWCDPKTGCSRHFWGRAMGWFCAALADVLEIFPKEHPAFVEIRRRFMACAEAVLNAQDPASGVWYQILDQGDRPGNYLEASASSLFVYALAKGIRLGWLPKESAPRIRRAYEGVIAQFVELYKGLVNLNKCCKVGGLGNVEERDGSFAYYISEPILCNDRKGVGAFLQASVEVEGRRSLDIES
ncbi:MAG TPA: glycoside hydrolase family 88 protein [Clostridia bacterium]|nr:glycoside hydrolase family 88 protein [Clostridia bacterium]